MKLPPVPRWFARYPRKIPLRAVLVVPFVLQTVGVVTLVGYLSYRSGQKAVENIAYQLIAQVGDRASFYLNDYLKIPHLVLMDMRMPVMDGFEAVRQIRLQEQNAAKFAEDSAASSFSQPTKMIAITATVFEEERQRILAVGCDDFIGKPCSETVVFDKLANHSHPHHRVNYSNWVVEAKGTRTIKRS